MTESLVHQPAIRLIQLCLGGSAEEIRRAAAHAEWAEVTRLAEYHKVVGLTYRGLHGAGIAVPPGLSARVRATILTGMKKIRHALSVSSALEAAGIPVMILKGAVEGLLAHGDPTVRPGGDIDLFLRPGDAPRAAEVLDEAGWHPTMPHLLPYLGSSFGGGDIAFRRAEGDGLLELHWRFTDPAAAFPLPMDEAMAGRKAVACGGGTLHTLADADRFLYLCVHGGRHRWQRLVWLCDVAAYLRDPAFPVDRILARADMLGARSAATLAAALAEQVLSVPCPPLLAAAGLPLGLRRLGAEVAAALVGADATVSSGGKALAARIALRDGVLGKLAIAAHALLPRHDDVPAQGGGRSLPMLAIRRWWRLLWRRKARFP
jgi:hypothetical protein